MPCYKISFSNGKITWIKFCAAKDIVEAVSKSLVAYTNPQDLIKIVGIERMGEMI